MNVSLPEELKAFAEAQTKNGYSTPSEYVRELIRADQRKRAQEKLDSMLLEGLRSGEALPADATFWSELKRDARAKLAARKRKSGR